MSDLTSLLAMYRTMLRIRRVDDALDELLRRGEITDHYPYAGQEAVAVGACAALRPSDLITSHYRGLGHLLARGGDLGRILAEYMGRQTGYCRGKGGAKHLAAFDLGVCGAVSIVGASIPMAAGIALACQRRQTGQVVACFFGDGASNQGTFHEGLNLAAILRVPVVYICENNQYALTTPVSYAVPIEHIADRSRAYGLPGIVVDGMDVLAVEAATREAVERARAGGGSTLIECKTYRFKGHFAAEFALKVRYRSEAEVESWRARDPLRRAEARLRGANLLSDEAVAEMETVVAREIAEALAFARQSPLPQPHEAFEDVFATPLPPG